LTRPSHRQLFADIIANLDEAERVLAGRAYSELDDMRQELTLAIVEQERNEAADRRD
jgi:hypothetical protein